MGFSAQTRVAASILLIATVLALVIWQAGLAELFADIREVSGRSLVIALVALALSCVVAILRVLFIARDLGYRLSFRESAAAFSFGSLAGALFFQIAGQVIARSAYLSRIGVPVGATVFMVGYERAVGLAVSLFLAAVGGWYTFGRLAVQLDAGGAEFVRLGVAVTAAIVMAAIFGWGRAALSGISGRFDPGIFWRLPRSVVVTLCIQLLTLTAYVSLALSLVPEIDPLDLAAALTVVMLGASLPISFAGWGVREMSAVLVLSAIGVPMTAALVTAALVGIVSLLVQAIIAFFVVLLGQGKRQHRPAMVGGQVTLDYGRLAAIAVPLAMATAVFFHIHVPVGSGLVNVSMADPLALLSAGLFIVFLFSRRAWPRWRLEGANLHILACTGVLGLGLVVGLYRFGWTDWAVTNKFIGWFVLLAYASGGALLVRTWSDGGLRILLAAFAATGIAIAAIDISLSALQTYGVTIPGSVLWRVHGFAENPNAFAFQMLMAISAALVAFRSGAAVVVFLAIAISAMVLSGSKSALITLPFFLAAAFLMGSVKLKPAAAALMAAAVIVVAIQPRYATNQIVNPVIALMSSLAGEADDRRGVEHPRTRNQPRTTASENGLAAYLPPEHFDGARLQSIEDGARMFVAHPLFGAGLGAYLAGQHGQAEPLTIHSTPVWLLAELGLVGFAIFLLPVVRLINRELRRDESDAAGSLILLIFVALAIMSLAHELLYQRTFWFLLGAALAVIPLSERTAGETAARGRGEVTEPPDRAG
jgi:hypothetical protein